MNCREFRTKIDEYADGSAEAEWLRSARLHIDGCCECRAAVENIGRMKQSLSAAFASETAPAGLAMRIRQAIADEAATPVATTRAGRSGTISLQRLIVPLAMAAAVGFVWFGSLLLGPSIPLGGPQSEVESTWVSSVREVHTHCISKGLNHHSGDLPRDVMSLRERLRDLLQMTILVPDLSSSGYKLHSADTCRIQGAPGAHLVFERVSDGKLVSLFTIGRRGLFLPTGDFSLNGRDAFVCANANAPVISWEDQNGTYVFCGEVEPSVLASLASGLN